VNAKCGDLGDWSYLGSPGRCNGPGKLAVDFFLSDYDHDGERYLAASLPSLPFRTSTSASR